MSDQQAWIVAGVIGGMLFYLALVIDGALKQVGNRIGIGNDRLVDIRSELSRLDAKVASLARIAGHRVD